MNPPDSQPAKKPSIGPGLVFALSVIGAGDYVSNTALGATYGTALLWALLVASVCRYVWIESLARYVLATGSTPFQGFASIGRPLVWLLLATMVVHRHVNGLYHVLFMGASFDLFLPLPIDSSAFVWSLVFVAIGFSLMFWAGYRTLETFFKILMAFMGGSLIVVVLLVPIPISQILKGLLIPSLPDAAGPYSAVLLLTALLGTEACSMSNVTYSYFMWQKGWRDMTYSARQRMDLLYGIGAMFMMGCLLQIAAAGTIGQGGKVPVNVQDLVQVFSARLGWIGQLTFALGIWAAVFTSFIGGITGYSLAIADVFHSMRAGAGQSPTLRSREESQRDPLYRSLLIFFAFSPIYILWTNVRPAWLVLVASSAVVVVVPILSIAVLRLTADRRIMGEYRNGMFANCTLVFVAIIACYFTYANGVSLIHKLK
jgi:Mn2+/Fe2+ NRAMP family transporter